MRKSRKRRDIQRVSASAPRDWWNDRCAVERLCLRVQLVLRICRTANGVSSGESCV
jgi:hypothetical protein